MFAKTTAEQYNFYVFIVSAVILAVIFGGSITGSFHALRSRSYLKFFLGVFGGFGLGLVVYLIGAC